MKKMTVWDIVFSIIAVYHVVIMLFFEEYMNLFGKVIIIPAYIYLAFKSYK